MCGIQAIARPAEVWRRIAPRILALFAASRLSVVKLSLRRQPSTVPRTKGRRRIPVKAVNWPVLVSCKSIGPGIPMVRRRRTLHGGFQGQSVGCQIRVPCRVPSCACDQRMGSCSQVRRTHLRSPASIHERPEAPHRYLEFVEVEIGHRCRVVWVVQSIEGPSGYQQARAAVFLPQVSACRRKARAPWQ